MQDSLDRIVWNSLIGPQAALSQGSARVKRFPPAFAPFFALAEETPAHYRELANLSAAGDRLVAFTPSDIDPGPAFEVLDRRAIVQMVQAPADLGPPPAHVVELTDADASAMRALADSTKPGPFGPRTHELGRFYGIWIEGRLVAMAGERMRPSGFTEVSAVCTLPDYRGRRYGELLVDAVSRRIFQRDETAVLHAFSDNVSAVGLYRKLGFVLRKEFRVTMMRRLDRDR